MKKAMIINKTSLEYKPFQDSRGKFGDSGQLYLTEYNGIKYLVKSRLADVMNEYVVHSLGQIIGVPTFGAVLIKGEGEIDVGIVFADDFKRISAMDFADNIVYPDDSHFMVDFISYLALRDIVVMDNDFQIAISENRIISFDYAKAFGFEQAVYGSGESLSAYASHLRTLNNFVFVLDILRRPKTDFLFKVYKAVIQRFLDADLQPIYDGLKAAGLERKIAFYQNAFTLRRESVDILVEGL